MEIRVERTARADADDALDSVKVEKLVGIYSYRRLTHSGRHDRHALTFIVSRIALNTPDVVHKSRVFKKVFGDKFGSQRIAGHKHRLREIPFFCRNMRCRN